MPPIAPEAEPRRVAYVMNGFPRLSETFIAHEIHQLERLGLGLGLFVVKDEGEQLVHPVVRAIRAPRTLLPPTGSLSGQSLPAWLRENLPRFVHAHARLLRRRPLAWISTLACACTLAWRHRPGDRRWGLRKVFFKEFLQAGWIADAVDLAGDIDHLHGHFCHGVTTITWWAARLSGLSFSFTAHAKDLYQADLNPGRLLERKLDAAAFVATCTAANAAVLRARHPRPAAVHLIYHGLDPQAFRPAPALCPAGAPLPPTVLAVGRLVEKKGFDRLIEACALLTARGLRLRCRIVGEDGSASAALLALVRSHGLDDTVVFEGPRSQDALLQIYRDAQVFALPCRVLPDGDRDGFPNVLAEAMACGLPVVSTRISGIPEMITNGLHGWLVEPDDSAALAAALERLLTQPKLCAQMGQAGRQQIVEHFDSRRTTQALHRLLLAQVQAAQGKQGRTSTEASGMHSPEGQR